jgi:polysaccharide biosynthesis transport protein
MERHGRTDEYGLLHPGPLLGSLRRQWRPVLATVIVIPLLTLIATLHQTDRYTADVALSFRPTSSVQQVLGTAPTIGSVDPARDAATHVAQLTSADVAQRTARALGNGWSADRVKAQIAVAAAGQSDIATVTATDPDPRQAARLATTYAQQFIGLRRDWVRADAQSATAALQAQLNVMGPADRNGRLAAVMRNQMLQLRIVDATAPSDVLISEHASLPTAPSSPRLGRNLAFGVVLGLLAGIGLALVLDPRSRRSEQSAELQETLALPLVATVPRSKALARSFTPVLPPYESEAFRLLDVRLRSLRDPVRSLLLTSAVTGEGKTTVGLHLARAWAERDERVLVIEADLRSRSLSRALGLPPDSPGLGELLEHPGVELADVWYQIPAEPAHNGDSLRSSFFCIPAGTSTRQPLALLDSYGMQSAIEKAVEQFDRVIIDAPPAGVVAEAVPLLRLVDGVLVVIRLDSARPTPLAKLRDQLEAANGRTLGIVANFADRDPESTFNEYTRRAARA